MSLYEIVLASTENDIDHLLLFEKNSGISSVPGFFMTAALQIWQTTAGFSISALNIATGPKLLIVNFNCYQHYMVYNKFPCVRGCDTWT